jgi:ABC-type phosphate transport system ATPase subunit
MATYSNFSKGSEWRKWDLHVHSNASDGTVTPDDIVEEAVIKRIEVIALTDHHTVKNIDEIKKLGSEKGIKIISGIEFRTEYGSSSVHMIGLFPDFYASTKLDSKFLYEQILCPLGLSETGINSKGKDGELFDDVSAFKKGMFLVQVDFKKAADLIHKYGGLVSVHAGSKSNSVEEMKHQGSASKNVKELYDSLGTVKEELLRNYIDICEIRKENDNGSFYLEKFGLPSIIASDAHNKSEIGTKYVWIKGDSTFEGLKQITYEPVDRVRIQNSNPNTKKLYNIIEKVKFIDQSGESKFSISEIGFNPDLNAIIGGKSSGKSLLLHSIAKAIGNKTDLKNYGKILEGIDLEVYYSDDPDKKRTPEDNRMIEFLPQQYIERIVREKSENTKISDSPNNFDKFVEDLILQIEEIKKVYDDCDTTIIDAENKIGSSIKKWIAVDRELSVAKNELKALGDKSAISREIDKTQKKIEELTKKAGLSENEIFIYTSLVNSNNICNSRINKFNQHLEEIKKIRDYIAELVFDGITNFLNFKSDDPYAQALFNMLENNIKISLENEINNFCAILTDKEKKIAHIISGLSKRIEKNSKELIPLLAKNKIQEEISLLENNITGERTKIALISLKEDEIIDLNKKRNGISFIEDYKKIMTSYNELSKKINDMIGTKWVEDGTNLSLITSSIYDTNKFIEALSAVINIRTYLENQFPNCGFSASNYIFTDDHIMNIENLLKNAISDEGRFNNFKANGDTEGLLQAILKNCFYIDFDIRKGHDSLQNMSEGKQGIIVLQLYLSLSKADCPILIDQPEDNLDNRTVYIELNDYIKQCKQRRQIIIVSHNANLVVNTDAENVIVANQAGEDGKDNKAYKFEYVNGALENTFTELDEKGVLYQEGIKEHVCEILEGGTDAFKKREEKYNLI